MVSENTEQYKENLTNIAESFFNGTFDFKDYYNVSPDGIKAIYAIGHSMYMAKKYDKAYAIFSILSILDSTAEHFYAQAASAFMPGNYELAHVLYSMAMFQGKYTPTLLEQLAECCAHLNKVDLLRKYAAEAIRLAEEDEFKNDRNELQSAERAKLILTNLDTLVQEELKKDNDKK